VLKPGKIGVVLVLDKNMPANRPFVLLNGVLMMAATKTGFGIVLNIYDGNSLDRLRADPAGAVLSPQALDLEPTPSGAAPQPAARALPRNPGPSLLPPDSSSAPALKALSTQANKVVRLNVGGRLFVTSLLTLNAAGSSAISQLLEQQVTRPGSVLQDEAGVLFIDRDPDLFTVVLNYLRTGKLILEGSKATEAQIIDELSFLGIPIVNGFAPEGPRYEGATRLHESIADSVKSTRILAARWVADNLPQIESFIVGKANHHTLATLHFSALNPESEFYCNDINTRGPAALQWKDSALFINCAAFELQRLLQIEVRARASIHQHLRDGHHVDLLFDWSRFSLGAGGGQ